MTAKTVPASFSMDFATREDALRYAKGLDPSVEDALSRAGTGTFVQARWRGDPIVVCLSVVNACCSGMPRFVVRVVRA